MKFETAMRWATIVLVASSVAASGAGKPGDKKDKDKAKPTSQTIDSGSFGVFVNGQRVVTETFSVVQESGNSQIKAQLKETGGSTQKSDLEITSSGELLHYEWSQPSGGSVIVVPNNDFLLEKITPANGSKTAEKPFLMPSTSSILDNNFFVHREVLVWRYLSADCRPEGGDLKCQSGPAEFGTLVPQDQNSASVRLELIGKEKVTLHGVERELLRLNLSGENFQWALWVDLKDHYKLMRVTIPADNTEVVRD